MLSRTVLTQNGRQSFYMSLLAQEEAGVWAAVRFCRRPLGFNFSKISWAGLQSGTHTCTGYWAGAPPKNPNKTNQRVLTNVEHTHRKKPCSCLCQVCSFYKVYVH